MYMQIAALFNNCKSGLHAQPTTTQYITHVEYFTRHQRCITETTMYIYVWYACGICT